MIIPIETESCRDCPHSTNSSREHDCAFTPAPHPIHWWCEAENGPESINDSNIIDPRCPFRQ